MSSAEVPEPAASPWNPEAFVAHSEGLEWTASSAVRRYVNALVSGNPDCDWVTWVEWKHLPPLVSRALVVRRGSGWLERGMMVRGRFGSIVACDAAPEAIDRARAGTDRQGMESAPIEHRVLDIEHEDLGGPFEAAFVNDVLHRVNDLEGVCARIRDALVPGGKLVFHEYVGPNRFQYTDDQMDLVNRYFRLLPDELRRDHVTNNVLWRRERVDRQKMLRDDPSGAVRSEEVLSTVRSVFETECEYPSGGGLLNPLLHGVIRNFREEVPKHQGLLQALCDAETRLSEAGVLKPDFLTYVGVRPPSS